MMELEKSKNIFGSGNEPISNFYKPSNEITNKSVRPSFGIGEIKANEQNQVKPMFNFNIKDNPQQSNNKFGKFDGKFIKLENSNKQQTYITKPVPKKTEVKNDVYSSDEKEEIQTNKGNVEYIDPFSNSSNNIQNSNIKQSQPNDLDDIFSSYQQTANPIQQNNKFDVNELLNNQQQADNYDFTFKNEIDPTKVIQNIKEDKSRSKVIDDIMSNNFPINSQTYGIQTNINHGGYANDPMQNNSSFTNPYNSGYNQQAYLNSNIYNQGNNYCLPNSSVNSYQMYPQQPNKESYNYNNLQPQQTYSNLNDKFGNSNYIPNYNGNVNIGDGNFNNQLSNPNSNYDNQGGNLDFFDTIKPQTGNFNKEVTYNQNRNNAHDLNKLDEFF